MMRAIARAVVASQYEVSRRRVAQTMRCDSAADLSTDQAILFEAVRVTAQAR
jgi:hypothetical protein